MIFENFEIINILYIFFLNILFLLFFSIIAKKINLLDRPSIRKKHAGEIPLVGGISIYLTLVITIYFFKLPYIINFSVFLMFFLVLIGFLDDLYRVNYLYKIIIQIIVIILAIGSGVIITDLGDIIYIQDTYLGKFSFLFTFICLLGLSNAINFIDGIDGFSSGTVVVSLLSLIFFKILFTNSFDFTIVYIMLIIIFSFFVVNIGFLKLPKIFLGDAGSAPIGFLLGVILVVYSQHPFNYIDPVLIPWCVTIPIFDLLNVSLKRMINKKNPFKPDNKHIHYILLNYGISQHKTLFILLSAEIIFAILGALFYLKTNAFFTLVMFPVFFVIYFFVTYNYEKKYS